MKIIVKYPSQQGAASELLFQQVVGISLLREFVDSLQLNLNHFLHVASKPWDAVSWANIFLHIVYLALSWRA